EVSPPEPGRGNAPRQQTDEPRRCQCCTRSNTFEIPIDLHRSLFTLMYRGSQQNGSAWGQSGSPIGPISAKTSPGPGVWMGVTTEMALDTPDRVQRGLYRTLYPRGRPRDVVTREENATLMGGQVVLHEVRVHPAVISVVSRQRTLERAERVFIGLPGDVIGSPTMWRAMSTSG